MPQVAIIIVHYNSDAETRACLESLKHVKTDAAEFSVVVVDNGSKEVFDAPKSQQPVRTVILRSDTNLGFTSGNNLGIEHAFANFNPDYICLLNNDTTVDPAFLNHLVSCLEKNTQAALVTPKIYFSPGREFHTESYTKADRGKVIWFAGGSVSWDDFRAFHRGVDEVDYGQFDQVQSTEFATGCCMLIRRSVLEQFGLFDPRYFLYLEDVDLSLRFRHAGYELLLCPDAKIWHVNAGSTGGAGSPLQTYYQTRNRLFFFSKFSEQRSIFSKSRVPNSLRGDAAVTEQVRARRSTFRTTLRVASRAMYDRARIFKLAWQIFSKGSRSERQAVVDWCLLRMGKRNMM